MQDTPWDHALKVTDGGMGLVGRARAKARAHVWALTEGTPAGFPWQTIAGKTLAGWLVIDMDATGRRFPRGCRCWPVSHAVWAAPPSGSIPCW